MTKASLVMLHEITSIRKKQMTGIDYTLALQILPSIKPMIRDLFLALLKL